LLESLQLDGSVLFISPLYFIFFLF
jgi:hypothetical protein